MKCIKPTLLIIGGLAALVLANLAVYSALDWLRPLPVITPVDLRVPTVPATAGPTRTFRPIPPWPSQTPVTPVGKAVTWTPLGAVCSCDRNRYNCYDFETAAQAQACYKFCQVQNAGDVHRLDLDGDGIVCERSD